MRFFIFLLPLLSITLGFQWTRLWVIQHNFSIDVGKLTMHIVHMVPSWCSVSLTHIWQFVVTFEFSCGWGSLNKKLIIECHERQNDCRIPEYTNFPTTPFPLIGVCWNQTLKRMKHTSLIISIKTTIQKLPNVRNNDLCQAQPLVQNVRILS